jgi:hydrogenase maturation protease
VAARAAAPKLGLLRGPSAQAEGAETTTITTTIKPTDTATTRSRRLLIGIGNPDRGDDGVGRFVGQRLRGQLPADIHLEEQDGDAAALIELLSAADSVWLIDAAVSGAPAGTIQRTDCTTADVLPAKSGASSHGLGVAEAIALTRLLRHLPRVCLLYTVEGVTFSPGAAMSSEVVVAAESLAAQLAKELRSD